jgi:glucose/arabinose dehydrogenase
MEPFETPAKVELQAHSAPLGIGFVPKSWPTEYQNNLIVAFHGSWNRTVPTGYKLVRVKLDAKGNYLSTEDFITGFTGSNKTVFGRPVDVMFGSDGSMYVTDDKAGVIYRVYQTN